MTAVAERHEALATEFEAFRLDPAFGAGLQSEQRETAFRRFRDRGFPTTRDEEWKFTSVAPIAALTFARAAAASPARAAIEPFLFAGLDVNIVLVNGRLARGLSSLEALPAGVSVRSSTDASDATEVAGTVFADLNTAFHEEVVTIDVAAKTIVAEPIHVLHLSMGSARPSLVVPRLHVSAGEASEVAIVESYAGAGDGPTLTCPVTTIDLAPRAVVKQVKIQRETSTGFHLASLLVRQQRASTFTSCALTYGGRIARNDITAVLGGEGAECTLDGLYVVDGDTVVDTHTTIDHAMPHCPSHELYKGILAGRSRAIFNGKIIVRQDAQKTNAKQTNKALLLTDEAQVNSKPQLEIFADDVKCTHGAAIGQLDDDALFYLRARGIGALEARNLLIHAFAGEVLDEIAIPIVHATAVRLMEEKLHLPS